MNIHDLLNEDPLGTNPKRPARSGARPARGHEPQQRYVTDRKTGKKYNPEEEFDKLTNSPEFRAQMKRMAQKEGAVDEHIGKVAGGYRLYSHNGKNLGTFGSKGAAEKHEREVQYFKHATEDFDSNIEQQHGDTKPWAYWGSPERVAKKLHQIYKGRPIGKDEVKHLWKVDGPDRMTKFMLKPDLSAILSNYDLMSDEGPLFKHNLAEGIAAIEQLLAEGRLTDYLPPFKATGFYVDDRRGNTVLEANDQGLAKDLAALLNKVFPPRHAVGISKLEGVAESRKANTKKARAELAARKRKEDPVQQDKKKKESDAAWERLMQYAADQKKGEQGVAEIAGAFPSPSTRQKWADDAAASNRAMAAQEAERQRRENAARAAKLAQDTKDVERLNKVNYHGSNAPQPSNATWDGDSSFLDLDGTQYAYASRMPISGDVPPDMKLIATQEGRQVYIWTRNSLKGNKGHYFYPAANPNTIQEVNDEMEESHDSPLKASKEYAKGHYPTVDDAEAWDKFVQRSLMHAKETDQIQSQQIAHLSNEIEQLKTGALSESTADRRANRLWQMITDYEKRAKSTKSDIRKSHYLQMADKLRGDLESAIHDANDAKRSGNEIARHDEEPSAMWENNGSMFDELSKIDERASRSLCLSSKPDEDLGASNLSSCKSQGLRARDGNKSHKLGKSKKSRVKVDGKRIKGAKYGGPLPDWS